MHKETQKSYLLPDYAPKPNIYFQYWNQIHIKTHHRMKN